MVREIATAGLLGAVLAGAAAGQQSVGVSAVILERIEPEQVEVEVQHLGSRLRVAARGPALPSSAGTRLLRSTYVRTGTASGAALTTGPGHVPAGGTLHLERRGASATGTGQRVDAGEALLIDVVERLTVTRVIAANS